MKRNNARAGAGVIAVLAVVLALVAGCGSSSNDAGSSSSAPTDSNAFPVTITHKFGSTKLKSAPKRVVSLGYTDQDALLAVGVTPVMVRSWDDMTANGAPAGAWALPLVKGDKPEIYKNEKVDPEAIAAMRPDLIVAVYSDIDKGTYDALSKIAPVIAQKGDYADFQQPWDVTATEIGTAVGRQDRAKKLVSDVKAKQSAMAQRNPGFAGKTVSVATYDGSSLAAFSGNDLRLQFFKSLGLIPNKEVDKAAGTKFYASLSLEEARKLNSDVIIWDQLSFAPKGKATILDQSALANLDAVKNNHSVYLDGELEKAFGWQTVLSLGYVLDHIEQPLKAALG